MAFTYTWGINSMESYPEAEGFQDVVCTVNWVCNGTDGTNNGAIVGSVGVKLNPDEPYTPYEELTENQVVLWVKETLGPDMVKDIETAVGVQITNNYYRPVVLPNPWS